MEQSRIYRRVGRRPGGAVPSERPNKWGADAIFRLKDDKLSMASYYKLSAAQGDTENCVAHNGSLIPVPGRDIEVQAGTRRRLCHGFHRRHASIRDCLLRPWADCPKMLVLGGEWSAYWYNGSIYGSEIARGLDVFELTPTSSDAERNRRGKTVRVSELNVQNSKKSLGLRSWSWQRHTWTAIAFAGLPQTESLLCRRRSKRREFTYSRGKLAKLKAWHRRSKRARPRRKSG